MSGSGNKCCYINWGKSKRQYKGPRLFSFPFKDEDRCRTWIINSDLAETVHNADFETAIYFARDGKFQRILLVVCGIVFAACAISTITLSFVLPAAECDFNLSSVDKGKLSAVPLIGMIFGCTIWGWVADTQGRKVAIMVSLLIDFLAAEVSASATSFQLFLLCRFFNGFGIIGATSIIFSYMGEFLSNSTRDSRLGKLEIFWTIGIILLPGVAWLLLSKSMMAYYNHIENFSSWRVFVAVCGSPSLISMVMVFFLPESPKYLISKHKYDEAKVVFQKIYSRNTGKAQYFYPVLSLLGENENKSDIVSKEITLLARCKRGLQQLIGLLKVLFSRPYLKYLAITCFADFGLMASYYTLIMWFPEIFARFEKYEKAHPNCTKGVCAVSEYKVQNINMDNMGYFLIILFYTTFEKCDPSIANGVFIETIIIGLSCIPVSVSLSILIRKIGKKNVLVFGLVLSGITTLLLNIAQSKSHVLILSCIFEALTCVLESVVFCVVVGLFPTKTRSIALSLTATSGRIGAMFGNFIFGILIDVHCAIPIYLFGILLIVSGILCLAVPRNEKYTLVQ